MTPVSSGVHDRDPDPDPDPNHNPDPNPDPNPHSDPNFNPNLKPSPNPIVSCRWSPSFGGSGICTHSSPWALHGNFRTATVPTFNWRKHGVWHDHER